jgi:hypothetical protein
VRGGGERDDDEPWKRIVGRGEGKKSEEDKSDDTLREKRRESCECG